MENKKINIGLGWRIPEEDFYIFSQGKIKGVMCDFKLPKESDVYGDIECFLEELGSKIDNCYYFLSNYKDEPYYFCLVLKLNENNNFGDLTIPKNINKLKSDVIRNFKNITNINLNKYVFSIIYGFSEN